MNKIFELINPDNTISLNRPLAHAIGLCEAAVYGALLAKFAYYEKNDMLTPDGWFYSTADDLRESTSLSVKQQRRCIDNLAFAGLIRCEQRGMPAKRYFLINDDISQLEYLLKKGGDIMNGLRGSNSGKVNSSFAETEKQVLPKEQSKSRQNSQTCSSQTDNKTKDNISKAIKPEPINPEPVKQEERKQESSITAARQQISFDAVASAYGEGFARLAADTVAEGLSGAFTITTDGRTMSKDEVMSVYKQVDYEAVCHVADYISDKNNIRNLPAYLRTALYTAVMERSYAPAPAAGYSSCYPQRSSQRPDWHMESGHSSIDMDDVMAELLAQYAPN